MRQENCFAVCGAYYTFLSAPVGSDSWREIFTAHHDDPNPIPHENVQFINSQIAYVFFGPKYAVTTDAEKAGQSGMLGKQIRVFSLQSTGCIQASYKLALHRMAAEECAFTHR